jgi:AcrR family transcriptional regulator
MSEIHEGAKTQRRRQLMHSAKLVFSEKGFHKASVSDIVGHAGIARGTFYLYFTGKRDIFDHLLDDLLEELRRRIRPIELAAGSADPLEQLKDNIRRLLELVQSDPELIQILLYHATGLDHRSSETLRSFYDRLTDMIEKSVSHGIRAGLLRSCDSRVAAYCILGMIKEVADWLTDRRRAPIPLEILVEEIIRFGLSGLQAYSKKI